ncbi:MAG: DUF4397 domain-containing protein [Bryobacteraceae bacterium]
MRFRTSAVVAAISVWTVGCTPAPTTSPSTTTTSQGRTSGSPAGVTVAHEGNSLVRFINAAESGKTMEVWSRDAQNFSLEYQKSSPYEEIASGAVRFELREPGAKDFLAANRRELLFGRHYTLVALPGVNRTARLTILNDSLGALEPGTARVRLINACHGVDDLDVYISGTKVKLLHGVGPGKATSFTDSMLSSFMDMDAGTLEIVPEGGTAPPQLSNLQVQADTLVTFIVVGTAQAPELLRIEDRIER